MGRFSNKKKTELNHFSDWFFHTAMTDDDGMVTIDDVSKLHTQKHVGRELIADEFIELLKQKVKSGDEATLFQLGAWAKAGYQEKLTKAYIDPVRSFYKKEDRLIYSVVLDSKRGWKFISSKDFGADQAALMNEKRRDAYQNNCVQLVGVLLERLENKNTPELEREKIRMQLTRFYVKQIKQVD